MASCSGHLGDKRAGAGFISSSTQNQNADIRIFPDLPVSSKPAEVRMGKGKGSPDYWAARVHPGRIMFELDGVSDEIAREALRLGAAKLPIKTRVVTRIS